MTEETILLRQINPVFLDGDRVGSSAFRPSKKDNGLLSVYDGDMISAQDAFQHFNAQLECTSGCVCGVTCIEASSIGLASRPDTEDHFPEHAIIDFTPYGTSRQEKLAKQLRGSLKSRSERVGSWLAMTAVSFRDDISRLQLPPRDMASHVPTHSHDFSDCL